MKKILKFFVYAILLVTGSVLFYLLTAFCLSRITISKEAGAASDVTIYIKTNGVHTDIIVPVKNQQYNWSKEIKFSNTTSNDTTMQWLAFGWGNRSFFLETPKWSDLKLSTAFNAAFGLGSSAMHTTFYHQLQEDNTCKKMVISYEQYSRLTAYLSDGFKKDSNGQMINIATSAVYSDDDAFYEGSGRYSMFRTCNSWANKALKVSGQKCCLWTAFDKPIFLKYNK